MSKCPIVVFQVSLFSEADIEIMFSIFDITNRGYINQTQYAKGMKINFCVKLKKYSQFYFGSLQLLMQLEYEHHQSHRLLQIALIK